LVWSPVVIHSLTVCAQRPEAKSKETVNVFKDGPKE
jgi:hypothetical protein